MSYVLAAAQSATLSPFAFERDGHNLLWGEEAAAVVAYVRRLNIRPFEAAKMHQNTIG